MAKAKDSTAAALAPANNNAPQVMGAEDALAFGAELGDLDFATDGLSEIDESDIKLPVIVWNVKGKDEQGRTRQVDQFYDTMNEVSLPTLRCVFLHLHKSNLFSRFNNDKNENVVHCSSYDRKTGRLRTVHPDNAQLREGTERPCSKCPDKDWRKDAKGKNTRNCDDVQSVFAMHVDGDGRPTGEKFLLRFKRTSLPAWTKHLNQHHLDRRMLPNGQRVNMPLFAFPIELSLELSDNGNYATPAFRRGPTFGRDALVELSQHAKYMMEVGAEADQAAEKQEAKHEAATDIAGGTSSGMPDGADFADT